MNGQTKCSITNTTVWYLVRGIISLALAAYESNTPLLVFFVSELLPENRAVHQKVFDKTNKIHQPPEHWSWKVYTPRWTHGHWHFYTAPREHAQVFYPKKPQLRILVDKCILLFHTQKFFFASFMGFRDYTKFTV